MLELAGRAAASPVRNGAIGHATLPLLVGEVEPKTAGMIKRSAQSVRTGLARRTKKYGPVAVVPVTVGYERVEDQVAGEHVERGEPFWRICAGRRRKSFEVRAEYS
jgi:hypothetical protein